MNICLGLFLFAARLKKDEKSHVSDKTRLFEMKPQNQNRDETLWVRQVDFFPPTFWISRQISHEYFNVLVGAE